MNSALVAEIEAEVAEFQRRRQAARVIGGTVIIDAPEHTMRDAAREGCTFVKRDPCVRCGVRYDLHGEMGCKRWASAP